MMPIAVAIMMSVLCLMGCAVKRTAQSEAEMHSTQMSAGHEVQTTQSDAQTLIDDDLEIEWMCVEFCGYRGTPPGLRPTSPTLVEEFDTSKVQSPTVKSVLKGKATRKRRSRHEEERHDAREVTRSDSTVTDSHTISQETENHRRQFPGAITVIGIIAVIVVCRKIFKR